MHRDVIGLGTLDFVLRIILARVTGMPCVVNAYGGSGTADAKQALFLTQRLGVFAGLAQEPRLPAREQRA
jgi:hypothetical protein